MHPKHAQPIRTLLSALAALCIFTATAEAGTLRAVPAARRFSITNFGAVADGVTLNTKAIQSAIDRCAGEGGGVVVVPPGVFVSGALFFKPAVNLLVERGGVLKGSVNPADYPQVNTRWEGVEREWTCAFLNFDHLTNVLVSGEGLIDGSGDLWLQRYSYGFGRPRRGADNPAAGSTNAPGVAPGLSAVLPVNVSTNASATNAPLRTGRPRLICFSHCRNVRLAGLHLQRQAVWCLHLLYCQHVVADHLNIRSIEHIPSSDGIDVDSCRDVQISHCDIACFDDNIAIKCGKDADGLRVNQPSEHITISDCVIGAGAGITMGSEVSGCIRHVVVKRCQFDHTDAAARFKSQPSRGGVIEDVVFRNIQLDHVRQAFEFLLQWRMVPPLAPPAKVLTDVRNVRLLDFTGTAQSLGVMNGLSASPIHDVKFKHCRITAQRGLTLANVKDLDLTGLPATVAEGAAIVYRDAAGTAR
jgi:polygalacturonase